MLASENPEQVKLGKLMGAFRAASMAQQSGELTIYLFPKAA